MSLVVVGALLCMPSGCGTTADNDSRLDERRHTRSEPPPPTSSENGGASSDGSGKIAADGSAQQGGAAATIPPASAGSAQEGQPSLPASGGTSPEQEDETGGGDSESSGGDGGRDDTPQSGGAAPNSGGATHTGGQTNSSGAAHTGGISNTGGTTETSGAPALAGAGGYAGTEAGRGGSSAGHAGAAAGEAGTQILPCELDCQTGYAPNDDCTVCVDIDECVESHGGCDPHADCKNTEGSHECTCHAYWKGTGVDCEYVGPCVTDDIQCGAHGWCVATGETTYECVCDPGYAFDGDECANFNECLFNNGGCHTSAVCSDTDGSRTCTCSPCWVGNGESCEYVGPCEYYDVQCGLHGFCAETEGTSYECRCEPGYAREDGACVNIDECLTNNGGCHFDALCQDTDGSRTCTCSPCWVGNGESCEYVGPCEYYDVQCGAHGFCAETGETSYECRCEPGYAREDDACVNVDECLTSNGGCHPKALCTDTDGSFTCACDEVHYTGDGYTLCEDLDECLINNGGCDPLVSCTDLEGSRECGACPEGCSGDGGTGCLPAPMPCETNPCLNGGTCRVNCAGTQTCTCPKGIAGPYCETIRYGFFVISDAHTTGGDGLPVALEQMQLIDSNPIAALSGGDHTQYASKNEWDQHIDVVGDHFDPAATTLDGPTPAYWAAVGNHDAMFSWGSSWYTEWSSHLTGQAGLGPTGSDGVYYSVGFRNALFLVMDSEHPSNAQTLALESALEESTATFKFLIYHKPVYPCMIDFGHSPFAEGLPWVDLAEDYRVDAIFNGHTHVYSRTCRMLYGQCTGDNTGIVQVEVGPVGTDSVRAPNVISRTVSGTDASGAPRTDSYNCTTNVEHLAGMLNSFCHVSVEDCMAVVDCYEVAPGNTTPFDSWEIDNCTPPEPPPEDPPPEQDGGVPDEDGGMADAGEPPPEDGGVPDEDGGMADAGEPPPEDGGMADAGEPPPEDGGVPDEDGGMADDAG